MWVWDLLRKLIEPVISFLYSVILKPKFSKIRHTQEHQKIKLFFSFSNFQEKHVFQNLTKDQVRRRCAIHTTHIFVRLSEFSYASEGLGRD